MHCYIKVIFVTLVTFMDPQHQVRCCPVATLMCDQTNLTIPYTSAILFQALITKYYDANVLS